MTTRCSHCGEAPARLLPLASCSWRCFRSTLRNVRFQLLSYDLGAGRAVVEQLADPMPREDVTNFCFTCAGQGLVFEPTPLGLCAVPCDACRGWGRT